MSINGNAFILHVGSRGAVYPIVVDPDVINVVLDLAEWAFPHLLKHLNTKYNIEPALCTLTGEVGCNQTAYAPSDQQAQQLGLTTGPSPAGSSGVTTLPADGSGAQAPVPSQIPQSGRNLEYDCPNDNSNIGKFVPSGHYWRDEFTAVASQVTGGTIGVGADQDGQNHLATVGLYRDSSLTEALGVTTISVVGYGGAAFSFPAPISLSAGQSVYFGVKGIGDLTVSTPGLGA